MASNLKDFGLEHMVVEDLGMFSGSEFTPVMNYHGERLNRFKKAQ